MTLSCGDAPVATDIEEAAFVVAARSKQKTRCRCRYKTNAMLLMQEFSKFQPGVVLTLHLSKLYMNLLVFFNIQGDFFYWSALVPDL